MQHADVRSTGEENVTDEEYKNRPVGTYTNTVKWKGRGTKNNVVSVQSVRKNGKLVGMQVASERLSIKVPQEEIKMMFIGFFTNDVPDVVKAMMEVYDEWREEQRVSP